MARAQGGRPGLRARLALVAGLQLALGLALAACLAPHLAAAAWLRLAGLALAGSALAAALTLRVIEGAVTRLLTAPGAAPAAPTQMEQAAERLHRLQEETERLLAEAQRRLDDDSRWAASAFQNRLPDGIAEATRQAGTAQRLGAAATRQGERVGALARAAAFAEGSADALAADIQGLTAAIATTTTRILQNAQHTTGATDAMRRTREAVIRLTQNARALSAELAGVGRLARAETEAERNDATTRMDALSDRLAAQLAEMAETTATAQAACTDIAAAITRMAEETIGIAAESDRQLERFGELAERVQLLARQTGSLSTDAAALAEEGEGVARAMAAAEAACAYVTRIAGTLPAPAPARRIAG